VNVSREKLVELLELQKLDSTIDRLDARRRALPEQAQLDALEERLSETEQSIAERQAELDEIVTRQGKLDGDIDLVTAKITSEEAKLHSGTITNPKELTDIQREVESLKRRRSGMEDHDLEVMEEREQAESVLAPLLEEAERLGKEIVEATTNRDRAAGDVIGQLEETKAERSRWVPKFDQELLDRYEELRAAKAGVGVAALIDGVCQGCHMRLPTQEYERVRKAEGMVLCDECRRILVVM
jgi:predicted  nucleic acid-binding Zn-ribbon protein